MNKEIYFATMTPYALIAAAKTQIPVQVILSQWAHESAYGTSDLAKRGNNHGGIKYTSRADFKTGAYSGYNSLFNFANDYAAVMQSKYYDKIRNAKGVENTVKAFVGSAYAEDRSYAKKLGDTISGNPSTAIIPLVLTGGIGLLAIAFFNK